MRLRSVETIPVPKVSVTVTETVQSDSSVIFLTEISAVLELDEMTNQ